MSKDGFVANNGTITEYYPIVLSVRLESTALSSRIGYVWVRIKGAWFLFRGAVKFLFTGKFGPTVDEWKAAIKP